MIMMNSRVPASSRVSSNTWAMLRRSAQALVVALLISSPAAAQSSLFARVLDGYTKPTTLSLDPLDDNAESEAVAETVEKILTRRGFTVAETAPYTLEIEIDPAAMSGYSPPSRPAPTADDMRDPLRQLAPTEALAPKPDRQKPLPSGTDVPKLAVTLTLYKGKAAIWTATAMAPRDSQNLSRQSVELALNAIDYFGRSATINPPEEQAAEPSTP